MKNKIQLLDCTLRDGGYINDWKFGHDNLVNIFERVVEAGIDVIEVGFLDDRRPFDADRSIMPDTECVQKIYGKLRKKNTMVVGMIDYGTCDIQNIQPCDKSFLDGIRVIFKKHLMDPALQFCKQLKDLGYKVFAQLVSVTSYSDEELLQLVRLANEVKPYAVSMVDTYGLLHQNNLQHYFDVLDGNLAEEIALGYHAHNNFQMGYANCIKMLSNNRRRNMLIDGSLYGMGKSAGNAPIELIAMYMNDHCGKNYNISQLLEAIDTNILPMYMQYHWGYNLFYYIAASNDCHPNYVSDLFNKQTLSVKSVNEILGKIVPEKKLMYDKAYIEELYVEYQTNNINDSADRRRLRACLAGKKILLIGPGATVESQSEVIGQYIRNNSPIVIALNQIPKNVKPDFIFLSNSKRYIQMATALTFDKYNIIATSNVTATDSKGFEFVLNYGSLIDKGAEIKDNSLVMLLKVLIELGVKNVSLAGFDGYSLNAPNFYNSQMEYDFIKDKATYLNEYMNAFLRSVKNTISIEFITETLYACE